MKPTTVIALTRAAYRQGHREGLDATRAGLEAERDRLQARVKQLERDVARLHHVLGNNGALAGHMAEIADLRRENERLTALANGERAALLAKWQEAIDRVAELTTERDHIRGEWRAQQPRLLELRAELETARQERVYAEARRQDAVADKARLDWLDSTSRDHHTWHCKAGSLVCTEGAPWGALWIREAIDAAMTEAGKP